MLLTENLNIKDFSYPLPPERIAQFPLKERDNSKLLVFKEGKICDDIFKNLSSHLPGDSLMIFNDTKVIQARIFFKKPSGAKIEIFCLEPLDEYNIAFEKKGSCKWKCFIGNASKWKTGLLFNKIIYINKEVCLSVNQLCCEKDFFVVEFCWQPENFSFAEVIDMFGQTPLPPYIKRLSDYSDKNKYQTIYAREKGSVAAPTAGLHFTENVLEELKKKKTDFEYVTLHVGAGTFLPVKDSIENHKMHTEFFSVSSETLKNLIYNKHENIISVGTTTLRTLESLYLMGVKLKVDKDFQKKEILFLDQWEAYQNNFNIDISFQESLNYLLDYLKKKNKTLLSAQTSLIIIPGYKFKTANYLITNFHMPQSTLLLLVAAFIGEKWKNAYNYALKNNFRFLSFGDSCVFQRFL
ncbi:MAG: S-adenosylmethionine:tRNA ribosyltransferase-isomerase [Bacteroidales bacterium]|nr:S-adenosylmethionine:tRNA ribosyltransferase-isomerase [Bacteroidales bacterium]